MVQIMNSRIEQLAEVRQLIDSGEAERIRKASRTSARECADSIEVSHTTFRRWEKGESHPCGDGALRYLWLLRRLQLLQVVS